jgi:predicted DNA-binding protein
VPAYVILDRDFRSEDVVKEIEERLKAAGVHPHVWKRHELENYLLEPAAISRLAGVEVEWVRKVIESIVESMEDDLYCEVIADSTRRLRPQGKSDSTIAKAAKKRADRIWADRPARSHACPGKEILSKLNSELQDAGHKAITPRALASALRKSEIPAECRRMLHDIDEAAS